MRYNVGISINDCIACYKLGLDEDSLFYAWNCFELASTSFCYVL